MPEIVTRDPDGIAQCYSDHGEDIRIYGACSFCGSDAVAVIGHVLPAVPRVKGLDPVEAAELVLSDQTMRMVDGVLLDTFSASALVRVYQAMNEDNQRMLRSWPLVKAVDACFRLINLNNEGK